MVRRGENSDATESSKTGLERGKLAQSMSFDTSQRCWQTTFLLLLRSVGNCCVTVLMGKKERKREREREKHFPPPRICFFRRDEIDRSKAFVREMYFISSLPLCPPLASETSVDEDLFRSFLPELENDYDQISLSDPSFVSSLSLSLSLFFFVALE